MNLVVKIVTISEILFKVKEMISKIVNYIGVFDIVTGNQISF